MGEKTFKVKLNKKVGNISRENLALIYSTANEVFGLELDDLYLNRDVTDAINSRRNGSLDYKLGELRISIETDIRNPNQSYIHVSCGKSIRESSAKKEIFRREIERAQQPEVKRRIIF